jgi:glutamate dehydrogenase
MNILHDLNRLIRRGTRWFLKNKKWDLDINKLIALFDDNVGSIHRELFKLLEDIGDADVHSTDAKNKYIEQGLSTQGVQITIAIPYMFSALDIVDAAITNKVSSIQVARLYFIVGAYLHLNWFREQIQLQQIRDHWDALARGAFIDDVDRQQRDITIAILFSNSESDEDEQQKVSSWLAKNTELLARWQHLIEELKSTSLEFTKFAVALRELLNLYDAILRQQSQ